jgi:translation initiation factor 2 subunit 2
MEKVENSSGLTLDLTTRRKKKKNKSRFDNDYENDNNTNDASSSSAPKEENYTYEYLLTRVFGKIKSANPEFTGIPSKTKLNPPKVLREGTKKTVFANFTEFCSKIQRDPNHVMAFILEELCANGSLDGTMRLIIRAKYPPIAIESLARKYIQHYVLCNECKSIDTLLDKDKASRLVFIKCNKCHASQSVK